MTAAPVPPTARLRPLADRVVARAARAAGYGVMRVGPDGRRYLGELADTSVPLPAGAEQALSPGSPRLQELRAKYAAVTWPCVDRSSWWTTSKVADVSLARFRGDNPFIWHYRELPRVTELKSLAYVQYLRARDPHGFLETCEEDGAFGCWTFEFEGVGRVSRDLIDAVNELGFLQRHLDVVGHDGLRVLDIGAGYGRLAHRAAEALPDLARWTCVDAIPESTFLCEYYTRHRGVVPPVEVVELPDVTGLAPGSIDLAVNVHSFSECTLAAITWWVSLLRDLEVPNLFVLPNEAEGFLSREVDGSRLDFGPVFESCGFRLAVEEPVLDDPAVRHALGVHDRFCLFERRT